MDWFKWEALILTRQNKTKKKSKWIEKQPGSLRSQPLSWWDAVAYLHLTKLLNTDSTHTLLCHFIQIFIQLWPLWRWQFKWYGRRKEKLSQNQRYIIQWLGQSGLLHTSDVRLVTNTRLNPSCNVINIWSTNSDVKTCFQEYFQTLLLSFIILFCWYHSC